MKAIEKETKKIIDVRLDIEAIYVDESTNIEYYESELEFIDNLKTGESEMTTDDVKRYIDEQKIMCDYNRDANIKITGYMARDKYGSLNLFVTDEPPIRMDDHWDANSQKILLESDLCIGLKWRDEPICVDLVFFKK